MQRIFALLLTVVLSSGVAANDKITICSDSNFWYPFTFVKDGRSAGLHIDIIAKALSNLGYQFEFKPLPWKRCLANAAHGSVDAVATASFKHERAEFLYYPSDAADSQSSSFRVMQVEYVVVTPVESEYEFNGDITSIPTPVRTPRGYSVADDLRKQGVEVDDNAPGDENNIKKLLRVGKGSAVMTPGVVKVLIEQDAYQGKLKVSKTPFMSKSYYLAIAKNSNLSEDKRLQIWHEVAKVRDDAAFMAEASLQY
ncbi:substrate-binding periplasmic protein [Alkalimarinus sediminis]|uniref:Transporter substrate-binding domain-containing protein n=1 Tax=Alkalimarinus sediminis TaxID=1632866 RepID=A0A9E8KNY4_9ALTE|nr:transporter substrate-binding domain-containing protein [Alkalimarinus sediminis]UZW74858.1 transporter substrate-binding domain-containing protein [Alkalimarinus sediminis]